MKVNATHAHVHNSHDLPFSLHLLHTFLVFFELPLLSLKASLESTSWHELHRGMAESRYDSLKKMRLKNRIDSAFALCKKLVRE